jgi:hypothetical protein
MTTLHPRLADWQTYGRTSEATLGNAAWKILAGRVDESELAEKIARCAHCRRLAPGRGHTVGCWHQAAALLFEQGLQPLSFERDPRMETPCNYRGCNEIIDWANGYHCERHAEILRQQRVAAGDRNRARARERNAEPVDRQRELYEAEMRSRSLADADRAGGV